MDRKRRIPPACLALAAALLLTACTQDSRLENRGEENGPAFVLPIPGDEAPEVEDGPVLLQIILSAMLDGVSVEVAVTEGEQLDRLSALLLDGQLLDSEEELEVDGDRPEILATVQDGPGSNYKLRLLSARDASGGTVFLIRGELASFLGDAGGYEEVLAMISQAPKGLVLLAGDFDCYGS